MDPSSALARLAALPLSIVVAGTLLDLGNFEGPL
jgi:hypothetical protein